MPGAWGEFAISCPSLVIPSGQTEQTGLVSSVEKVLTILTLRITRHA